MKIFFTKHTLICLFLFIFQQAKGQDSFDLNTEKVSRTLEGKTLQGYTTNVAFSREEVRRGWWEYARTFGAPLNMKEYYKIKIPSETNDGNVDLWIFTQSGESDGKGTAFFLGIENDQYLSQAHTMIRDFKRTFYIKQLTKQMDECITKTQALSKSYEKAILDTRKKELLNKIVALEAEVGVLKERVKKVENE